MFNPFNQAWQIIKSRQILKFSNPETGEAWSSPEVMDDTEDEPARCPRCNKVLNTDDDYIIREMGACMNCWRRKRLA